MVVPYVQAYIDKVQEKYHRKYLEFREQVTDPVRLHCIDEAHQQFLHDFATDVEEAFDKMQRKEIARRMKRREFSTDDIAGVTGLSSTEIDRLG
jgi:hypothetical protein